MNNDFNQVEVLEPLAGQVDQVFCANCALVWNGTAVISNMANEPRRAESEPSMKWFKHHGYEVSFLRDYTFMCFYYFTLSVVRSRSTNNLICFSLSPNMHINYNKSNEMINKLISIVNHMDASNHNVTAQFDQKIIS